MLLNGRVVGFIVKVAHHHDVGLWIGGEEGVDPLTKNIGGLVAERFIMESRRPVVHEYVQVVAIAPELGLDDVTRVFGVDMVELRLDQREYRRVVYYRAIDAA